MNQSLEKAKNIALAKIDGLVKFDEDHAADGGLNECQVSELDKLVNIVRNVVEINAK